MPKLKALHGLGVAIVNRTSTGPHRAVEERKVTLRASLWVSTSEQGLNGHGIDTHYLSRQTAFFGTVRACRRRNLQREGCRSGGVSLEECSA